MGEVAELVDGSQGGGSNEGHSRVIPGVEAMECVYNRQKMLLEYVYIKE